MASDCKIVLYYDPSTAPSPMPLAILNDAVMVRRVAKAAIKRARQKARRVPRPERAEATAQADSLRRMLGVLIPELRREGDIYLGA